MTFVRVMTKGWDVHITRLVQKLYPIEIHAGPNAGKRQDRNRVQGWLLWMRLKG